MVDVIFKKNYFEELPDDIKDIILKKAKKMKEWDIINKGTDNLYKKRLYQGVYDIYDIGCDLNSNFEVLELIPFSINNIDLIFDTFKIYYIVSYWIVDVKTKYKIWEDWRAKPENDNYYQKTHYKEIRKKIPEYKYHLSRFILEYRCKNAYKMYNIFENYLIEYVKYIDKIDNRYEENCMSFCRHQDILGNNIYIDPTPEKREVWNIFNKKITKYYNKNVKCNKKNYDKIKLMIDYLYDIDNIMIEKIQGGFCCYGMYGKEIYEKIKGHIETDRERQTGRERGVRGLAELICVKLHICDFTTPD